MQNNTLEALTKPKTEKSKLLALDGGGIRGIIAIEVLAKIEKILQQKLNKDDFVLADYFDYIAGTSTGAIIAACLSKGMRVDEIRPFYIDSGEKMFSRARLLEQGKYKYKDKELAEQLQSVFGDETLGSQELKTLLMMVMRNATTDSPWPISNNPHALYNDRNLPDCNLKIPLWRLIRASTAAPTFFPPEEIKVSEDQQKPFVFVDGGVTSFNNPAFQLFSMATAEPYNLNWETGEDKMLLVSIGTGLTSGANKDLEPGQMNLLYNAKSIPSALMYASQRQQDFLCRFLGNCLAGDPIDGEIGDMIGKKGSGDTNLFTYLRYNADLSEAGLKDLSLDDIDPKDVQSMDCVEHLDKFQRVGEAIAEHKVDESHFAGFLD